VVEHGGLAILPLLAGRAASSSRARSIEEITTPMSRFTMMNAAINT